MWVTSIQGRSGPTLRYPDFCQSLQGPATGAAAGAGHLDGSQRRSWKISISDTILARPAIGWTGALAGMDSCCR